MRILIITATYVPSINGIAITLLQQKEELEKRGHDVTLVAPYHQDGNIEKNVIRVPSLPNPFASDYPIPVPFIRSLKSFRKIRKAEIIYFHHPFYMGKLSLMLAKSWKVPSVFFYHTQYKKYTQNFLPNNYLFKHIPDLVNRQVKNIINSSDAVIVETNSVLDELKKQGIKVKITVIPTGRKFVSRTNSIEDLRIKYKIPSNKVVILTVSRLSKEKNLNTLINIYKKLKRLPEAILVIVGDGSEKQKLINLCKINNIENVLFTGKIDFSEIHEFYQLADVFAYPSISDTQAIVLSEAMSFGLPLIGFSAPGPIDFINHAENGFIAHNETDFLAYLEKLISRHDLRKRMGARSYLDSGKYTFENTVNLTEQLFREVINNQ